MGFAEAVLEDIDGFNPDLFGFGVPTEFLFQFRQLAEKRGYLRLIATDRGAADPDAGSELLCGLSWLFRALVVRGKRLVEVGDAKVDCSFFVNDVEGEVDVEFRCPDATLGDFPFPLFDVTGLGRLVTCSRACEEQ